MTKPMDAADEVFHPAGDDVDWNESGWFGFAIPQRDINGFFYYFHDIRTGVSGGGPALWDPSGEEAYDCLFYDWRWHQPPTGPLDFQDFCLPNSLRHRGRRTDAALPAVLLAAGAGTRSGVDRAHGAARTWPCGPASTPRHFDQPGRMAGSATLNGERLDVDCYSLRDRTWGPHRPGATPVRRLPVGDRVARMRIGTRSPSQVKNPASTRCHGRLSRPRRCAGRTRQRESGGCCNGDRARLPASSSTPKTTAAARCTPRARCAPRCAGSGWPGRLTFWTLTDWRWDGVQGYGEDQEFFAREQVRALHRLARCRQPARAPRQIP